MEALNELFLFIFVILLSLVFMPLYHPIDDSLYKFMLFKDIINIFWMKGGFEENFYLTNLEVENSAGLELDYNEGELAYTSYFPIIVGGHLVGYEMKTIYLKKV